VAAPSPTPKIVAWPFWFAGADFLLFALALSLAFLVSSFVARNTDIWLHLAAGQRLLKGEYSPGTDPFSYAAADRAWVNHSLLFDIGAYLLYRGDGVLLIVLKALAAVLTFGLLIGIRRQEFALWPWAAVAGVAILAAAPRLLLSPLVGSTVLLSATLYLIFRFPHRPGSWRFPAAIGVIFWIWAQMDNWFILGPIALGLILIGELVQAQFLKSGSAVGSNSETEPLGSLPDVSTLAKALGIGLLACMLNPHHYRIWELPFELIGAKEGETDLRLRAQMLLTPLSRAYYENSQFGNNLNGLAYAFLFVGGGLVMALGIGRIRFAYIALWLGFAFLSLTTVYAIPFFAVVSVPLVASRLNAYSSTFILKDWDDPRTKFAILGSASGRVVCLIFLSAACVLAWPGWMQPPSNSPSYTRRVAWGIEPDAGLVRTAHQLQTWRESGSLPSETRGVILSVDLANYCAWFAPLEKVFLNGNYNHHRTELSESVALRNALGASDIKEVGLLFKKIGAEYLVLTTTQGDMPSLRKASVEFSIRLWADGEHWSPWYMDGRAAISGRKSALDMKRAAFPSIQIDPVTLAFGSGVERLPAPSVSSIPPPEGWAGEFIHGVGMSPPSADEAIGWLMYKKLILERHAISDQILGNMQASFMPAQCDPRHRLLTPFTSTLRRKPPDELMAIPILAYRAARRAIAADPNHPDGYFALYSALSDPDLPMPDAERTIGQVTALRQCLYRMPSPERIRRNSYLASGQQVAHALAAFYYGQSKQPGFPITGLPLDFPSHFPAAYILGESPWSDGVYCVVEDNNRARLVRWRERGQRRVIGGGSIRAIDLAHEMMVLALQYAEVELLPDVEADISTLRRLKTDAKSYEDELSRRTQEYEREKPQAGPKVSDQVRLALRHNFVGEALKILTDKGTDLAKEYGAHVPEIVVVRIALEMATGRLEDAASDLEDAPKVFENSTLPDNILRIKYIQLLALTYQKLLFEGNFAVAGEIRENDVMNQSDKDPPLTPLESAIKPGPFFAVGSPQIPIRLSELASVPPIAIPIRRLLLSDATQPFLHRQQQLIDIRRSAADLLYQSGFSALLQADIPTARRRFELSHRSGVSEWGVPPQRNPSADLYLQLIKEAETKTKK
jgi:hypothetical protein